MRSKFKLLFTILIFVSCFSAVYPQSASWESLGPNGGKVSILVQDPKDANTIYTASFGNETRLFKTTNAGTTWKYYSTIKASISNLYIDEKNPSLFIASSYNTVFKSVDKGITWQQIPFLKIMKDGKEAPTYLLSLKVNAKNPNLILGCGGVWADTVFNAAIFKSIDGGNTWTYKTYTKDYGMFSKIISNPGNPDLVYIAGNGREGQKWSGLFYKSTDGGVTLEKDKFSGQQNVLNDIIFDPADPKMYYGFSYQGFYTSTDAGETWTLNKNYPKAMMDVIYSPKSKTMYAMAYQGLHKSTDFGATWSQILKYTEGQLFEKMVIDPKTEKMIASDGSGVKLSVNGGKTWKPINDGLTFSSIAVVRCVPSQPENVYISAEYSGVFKIKTVPGQTMNAKSAKWTSLPRFYTCTALADLMMMPDDPKVLYALEGGG